MVKGMANENKKFKRSGKTSLALVHKPPSRIKYEEKNPTVSCRVSKEIYNRLKGILKKDKKSMADILKIGLGLLEVKVEKENAVYQQGYKAGYLKAEEEFKVVYRCSVCRKPIEVDSEKEKAAISSFMEKERWGHHECINNQK